MIPNFATFRSSLPDDSIEADGEIVVPCGRGLMDLIRTAFQRSGFEASEIDQHSHYGWSFDASGAEGRFWLMIQYPEPWLLMIQDSRAIWKRAFQVRQPMSDSSVGAIRSCNPFPRLAIYDGSLNASGRNYPEERIPKANKPCMATPTSPSVIDVFT